MMNFDLNSDLDLLKSRDLTTKIAALERLQDAVSLLVKEAVQALEDEDGYFIAERLARFGSIAIKPLEDFLKQSQSFEAKVLASLVLMQLGSKSGTSYLIDAVLKSKNYYCLAARFLVREKVVQAADNMITRIRSANARLRSATVDDMDLILCLLRSLRDLGVTIPGDIRDRLAQSDVPYLLRLTLDKESLLTDE